MKKALFVTTIGGFLQQFEMNDVSILQEAGYDVHYASNFDNPIYEVDYNDLIAKNITTHGIEIQKSPLAIRANLKSLKQLKKVIKEEEFDLVHCHNPLGGVIGRLATVGLSKRPTVIYTAHGFHFYEGAPLANWLLFFPVEFFLSRYTDKLVTINREDYKRACSFPLRKGGKAYKIPGVGINVGRFSRKPGIREKKRKELGIADDTFFLLSVGELNHNKNHSLILQALSLLPDVKIHYGVCGRGQAKEELQTMINELGLADRITLYGFRTDIPEMLAAADCFVFPSKREGLGIAALEAMAAGVPLITSDCRGTREYMEDGKNGIMCKNADPETYRDAILRMMEQDEMRANMSEECVRLAKNFDITEADRIMRKVYNDD